MTDETTTKKPRGLTAECEEVEATIAKARDDVDNLTSERDNLDARIKDGLAYISEQKDKLLDLMRKRLRS